MNFLSSIAPHHILTWQAGPANNQISYGPLRATLDGQPGDYTVTIGNRETGNVEIVPAANSHEIEAALAHAVATID